MKSEVKVSKLASGAFILLVAGVICKLLGAFYRVPLSNILGTEGIGVYQLIFPIYSLVLIIVSGGIPIALSKLVAECRARNEFKRAKRLLLISFCVLTLITGIFSIFFIVFNEQFSIIQGNDLANLGYIAVGVALFFSSILTSFRGYFQGFQLMLPTAISQIIEQVGKLVLGLILARYFLKYGLAFGVFGALLGISISEVCALIYLMLTYFFKKVQKNDFLLSKELDKGFWFDLKLLIKKSIPITLNSLILPLILAVDSFIVVNILKTGGYSKAEATSLFGIFSGMVNSLINFPTVVAMAISVAILPSIAYENEKGNTSLELTKTSFKIALLIAIPSVLIFVIFAPNILSILYPRDSSVINVATILLQISSINIITISFLQISTSVMQAINKSYISLVNLAFAGILKVALTIYLVASPLNIYGAAIASLVGYLIAASLNMVYLISKLKIKIEYKRVFNIILASLICVSFLAIMFNLFRLFINANLCFIISAFFAAIVYLFFIIFLPVFKKEEIENIPFISKLSFIAKRYKINTLNDEILK